MGPLDFLNHVLNFVAPALFVAVVVSLLSRIFNKKWPLGLSFIKGVAINFVVCAAVLVVGLVVFGVDAKMLTYATMVLACATSQWWLLFRRR